MLADERRTIALAGAGVNWLRLSAPAPTHWRL